MLQNFWKKSSRLFWILQNWRISTNTSWYGWFKFKKNDRNNTKTFVDHYYRVHELLKQKYELEIPLTNSLIQRFLEDGVNDIYEIYNDGKVVLKFTKRKVGYAFLKG